MRHPRRVLLTRTLAGAAALALVGAGCSDSDEVTGPGSGIRTLRGAPVALQSDRGCDAVLEDFQAYAPSMGYWGDVRTGAVAEDMANTGSAAGTAPGASAVPTTGAGSDGSTSSTNTQEEGIDEPDVVETDGEHVYLVDNDALVVMDTSGAVVGRVTLGTYGAQLLLQGDRLLAISAGGYAYATGAAESAPVPDVVAPTETKPAETEPGTATPDSAPDSAPDSTTTDSAPDATDVTIEPAPEPRPIDPQPVDPPSFQAGTTIQIIDVSDPSAPVIVESDEIEGYHVSTRVVDGVARVVVSSYPSYGPMVGMVDDVGMGVAVDGVSSDLPMPGGAAVAERDGMADAIAAAEAAVEETTIDDWLPAYRTTIAGAEPVAEPTEAPLVDCSQVFMPEVNAGVTETSVLRVDFETGFDPADTVTVVAEAGTVYASTSTLYLAATEWVAPEDQSVVAPDEWNSAVHAFDLTGDGPATHVAAGTVPGTVLNQYSMSEFDGDLRVATTEGTPWGEQANSQSGVHVLRRAGEDLTEVGVVDGLGVTETIQSVRFLGPVAYVVTFRQTDPLYVIDLSDPTAPTKVGELKIPGFSAYLHPAGDGRLIGIGRDADAEGADKGFLASLFDVSDPTAPLQLQTFTDPAGSSNATWDPKAFLYWGPESIIAIPYDRMLSAPGGDPAAPEYYASESGILVLDVSDGGIVERGTVEAQGAYASRALVVDGRLWSLFDGVVAISDFEDVAAPTLHAYR